MHTPGHINFLILHTISKTLPGKEILLGNKITPLKTAGYNAASFNYNKVHGLQPQQGPIMPFTYNCKTLVSSEGNPENNSSTRPP